MALHLSKNQRLRRLLSDGYFPEELPPPFVTTSFARYRTALETDWSALTPQQSNFHSSPETFNVPKHGHARRRVVITNPINQYRISKLIADNWVDIRDFLKRSKISEFRPIFNTKGPRSIFGINWNGVTERRTRLSARYAHQIQTDISRFYGSVYTHSIAWAMHGKQHVQSNLNTAWLKATIADRVDVALRHGQRNQSVGLPIGPDTSRIVSEIVAVGIDVEISRRLPDVDKRGLRYVDDILIGIDENESEDEVISAIEGAFTHFELDMNFEKTKITGRKTLTDVNWNAELSSITVSNTANRQRDDLCRFFDRATHYADIIDKDAVLKWAIKRSRSFLVVDTLYTYYIEKLISICRRAPACLPALAQILIDGNHKGKVLPTETIRKFCIDMIRDHSNAGHAFEVSWALFLCKGLRLTLQKSEVQCSFEMRSSVCALLLMDLDKRNLINGGIDDGHWKSICANTYGLKSDMWLLSYEADAKQWWSGGPASYVTGHPLFGLLQLRGVSFYDTNKNVPTTSAEKSRSIWQALFTRSIFARWEEYF